MAAVLHAARQDLRTGPRLGVAILVSPAARFGIWAVSLTAGLIVRLVFLQTLGSNDMVQYARWGHAVANHGLAAAYEGIYFPLQYQVFGLTIGVGNAIGRDDVTSLKLVNLLFDVASLVALIVLLNALRLPAIYALFYWVHPYFMAISWLGYIDVETGLLVLIFLLALARARTPRSYLVAGIPLGLALVMKPQADYLGLMLLLVVISSLVLGRRLKLPNGGSTIIRQSLRLAVAPLVIYAIYTVVLAWQGLPISDFFHTLSPSGIAEHSPGFSGLMPNVWYIVSVSLVRPGQDVFKVYEPSILNLVALVLTVATLVGCTVLLLRKGKVLTGRLAVSLFGIAFLAAPNMLTHSHENHLFYGAMLGIVMIALMRNTYFTVALNILLLVQFVNLVGWYGLGNNSRSSSGVVQSLMSWYSKTPVNVTTAAVGVLAFAGVLVAFTAWALTSPASTLDDPERVPGGSHIMNWGVVAAIVAFVVGGAALITSGPSPKPVVVEPVVVEPGHGSTVEGNVGTSALRVSVSLSRAPTTPVTVTWRTVDPAGASGLCRAFTQTKSVSKAEAPSDYVAGNGSVTFSPGATHATIAVTIKGDRDPEPDECVLVALSTTTPGVRTGGAYGLGVGVIKNDD